MEKQRREVVSGDNVDSTVLAGLSVIFNSFIEKNRKKYNGPMG